MEAEESSVDSPDRTLKFETDHYPPVEQGAQAGAQSLPAETPRVARLRSQGVTAFGKADVRSKGVLGVIGMAAAGFMRDQGTSAAAAITYYAVLGLFPLLVMAVTLIGPLLGRDRVLHQVLRAIEAIFPVGQAGLERALVEATSASASLRVAGVILLIWSASGFLTEVKLHIDRAWLPLGGRPSSVRERGQAVLSIGLLLALLVVVVLLTWIVSPIFTSLSRVPMLNSVLVGFLAPIIEWLLVWLVVGCLVFAAYVQITGARVWRLAKALWTSDLQGLARYDSIQPHYSLVHRAEFERELKGLCEEEGIGVIPYSPLAAGFLTGKYRRGQQWPDSARAEGIRKRYDNERSWKTLDAMDRIATAQGKTVAQVALAWQLSQPVITSPIIGANSVDQLADILGVIGFRLNAEEMQALNDASAWE